MLEISVLDKVRVNTWISSMYDENEDAEVQPKKYLMSYTMPEGTVKVPCNVPSM